MMGFFPLFGHFSAISLQKLAKTPTFYVKKVRISKCPEKLYFYENVQIFLQNLCIIMKEKYPVSGFTRDK